LIVEDSELNRDLLTQILDETFTLLMASDGQAGLDLAERERPDLVLLDLSLPIVDGWEVARRLKANARTRGIPLIALTAHAMRDDERRAVEAGCDAYVAKPLDEDVLLATIHRLLGGREEARGPSALGDGG
jgi:CheY-like chemotaxis protein